MKKDFIIITIQDGVIQNSKKLRELVTKPDGKYLVEISKWGKRTLPQNRYLHGILIPEFRLALNSVGYNEVKTNEQSKLILKSMFLTKEIPNESGGKPVHFVKDTSDLTKEEMSLLIDEVIQFAAEHMSYQIPFPNEQLSFYQ